MRHFFTDGTLLGKSRVAIFWSDGNLFVLNYQIRGKKCQDHSHCTECHVNYFFFRIMFLKNMYLLSDRFYTIKMSVENNVEITKTIVCTSWHLDKLYNFNNEFIGGYFHVMVIDRTMKLNKMSKNILLWSNHFY